MHMQDTNIQVVLYIANKLKEKGIELWETKLYKLLWFASLWMANNQWSLILKDAFIKKQFWPVPENLREYIDDIKNLKSGQNEYIKITLEHKNWYRWEYKQNTIEALQDYNDDFFTPSMKEALDKTIEIYSWESAGTLSDMSHSDAWKEAEDDKVIDITKDMTEDKYKELVKEEYQNTIWILTKLKYAF